MNGRSRYLHSAAHLYAETIPEFAASLMFLGIDNGVEPKLEPSTIKWLCPACGNLMQPGRSCRSTIVTQRCPARPRARHKPGFQQPRSPAIVKWIRTDCLICQHYIKHQLPPLTPVRDIADKVIHSPSAPNPQQPDRVRAGKRSRSSKGNTLKTLLAKAKSGPDLLPTFNLDLETFIKRA